MQRIRKFRRNNLSYERNEGSSTVRMVVPTTIFTDKEDLYLDNLRMKQTINELREEVNKSKVKLANKDDQWMKKVRLLEKHSLEDVLQQDLVHLKRKNQDITRNYDYIKQELSALHKKTRVTRMLQMEQEIASLKQENQKLQFQIKLMSKHSGEQTYEAQKGYEIEAINYAAALRIQKLMKKNEQYRRQIQCYRQQNQKLRLKLIEFQSQLDILRAQSLNYRCQYRGKCNKTQQSPSKRYSKQLELKLLVAEKKIKSLQKWAKFNQEEHFQEMQTYRNEKQQQFQFKSESMQQPQKSKKLQNLRQIRLSKLQSMQISKDNEISKLNQGMKKAKQFAICSQNIIKKLATQNKQNQDSCYDTQYKTSELFKAFINTDIGDQHERAIQFVKKQKFSAQTITWEHFIQLFNNQIQPNDL